MLKNKIFLAIIISIVLLTIVFAVKLFSGEDDWICDGGEWVKHGNPSAAQPIGPCFSGIGPGLTIISPKANEEIKSPVVIKGYVNGDGWSGFEALVGIVKVLGKNGELLASAPLAIQSDWMKLPAYFETTLDFVNSESGDAKIVFSNENPSGLPEKDKTFVLPVKFGKAQEIMEVNAYFLSSRLDPEMTCNKSFPVVRKIAKTQTVGMAALQELLKGPTLEEQNNGYSTTINYGVKVQSLIIKDKTAYVDFDKTLEEAVGGSCRVAAIRSQISNTLKQFVTVEDVVISVNGRTEDILQP
ncbi:MAG: GerMN domain-containing protein [bacterium]|nr:GerMN domain-containing protein [bacterium]